MKNKFIVSTLILLAATASHLFAGNKATVIAYCPAPGQFVNELPQITAQVDSVASATIANEKISKGMMVTLGGFGGYMIVKFDSPVENRSDGYDFVILGNAFDKSAEPGIVMVSSDTNNNGIPDDEWYEIAGSEYDKSTLNYCITYHKPTSELDASKEKVEEYIRWTDNQGGNGWIPKNSFHNQSYYPMWAADKETISFTGTLLPDNAVEVDGVFNLMPYPWGYADNQINSNEEKCGIDIDWAVNSKGEKVKIDKIDFVRIHTGINAVHNQIGETSTEISKIYAYSGNSAASSVSDNGNILCLNNTLYFNTPTTADGYIFNIHGNKMAEIPAGTHQISLSRLPEGIYIYRSTGAVLKFVVR